MLPPCPGSQVPHGSCGESMRWQGDHIPALGSFTAKQLTPGEYEIRFQDLITGEMNKFAPHRLEERMTDAGQVIGQGYTVTL